MTFGINTNVYLAEHQAADSGQSYSQLCDWLENQLTKALAAYVHTPNVVSEPFRRTGETISVRIAFWNCDVLLFEHLDLHGWEVLEVAMFGEVYPGRAWNDLYTRAAVREYHALLRRDPECCETCGTRCIVVRHAADNEGGQPYIQSDCPECCTSTTTTEFAPVTLPSPPIRPGKDA